MDTLSESSDRVSPMSERNAIAADGASGIDILGIDSGTGCSDNADDARAPGPATAMIVNNMPKVILIIQNS